VHPTQVNTAFGDTDPLNKAKVLSKAVEKLPYRESFHKRFLAAFFFYDVCGISSFDWKNYYPE